MMKIIQWSLNIIGVSLILSHAFWPEIIKIDGYTILVFFILYIPFIAQYVRKAKLLGAEFEFKNEIQETKILVKQSVERAEKAESAGKAKILPFETFKLSTVKELLSSDPVLALASLRIEIEKRLRTTADILELPSKERFSISKAVEALGRRELLSAEQVMALRKIIEMCNKAVHGFSISMEEAKEIINLAEELNRSFSIGYSIAFTPNPDYERHGLVCEWEHCIEWMPLSEKRTKYSCPVFEHNCPGGLAQISKCGKTINDIPKERFAKKS
ncbi:hypothetical protein MUO65_04035 [bacterium]|nr:hypothetical protein [bacterium]